MQALDEQVFVGRERELASFRTWLEEDRGPSQILHVSGPGGVGKTVLLRHFQYVAQQVGHRVVLIDAHELRPTAEDFRRVLAERGLAPRDEASDRDTTLILLDALELLADLTHFLQTEFLPTLGPRTRLVLAGRQPLGLAWGDWLRFIQPLELQGFSDAESRTYLGRRQLTDPHLVDQIVLAGRGHPLALSLAADMVLQRGGRQLTSAPQWHLITHSVVEQLLRDVVEPGLRELLEVCAIVRQFDESTLSAVAGAEVSSAAFDQLCRLSLVRPSEHGLMLHDDIQRILADELRWRHPERYRTLRLRALGYYRDRVRSAAPADREWLVQEQLALCENAFLQALVYTDVEAGEVWLDVGSAENLAEVRAIWWYWVDHALSRELEVRQDLDRELVDTWLQSLARNPAAHLVLARDRDARVVGFLLSIPICGQTLPLLDSDWYFGPLLRACWTPDERRQLPHRTVDATAHYLLYLAHTDDHPEATRAALLRESFSLFAQSGTYLCCTPIPAYKTLFQSLGFDLVTSNPTTMWSDTESEAGFVLDLTSYGVERWVEAIINGRQLARAPRRGEVPGQLLAALQHWQDAAWLDRSPLVAYITETHRSGLGQDASSPAVFRSAVEHALRQLQGGARSDRATAYRALELAYLHRSASHEHLAEALAVSRSTFYRYLDRAVRDLADQLTRDTAALI